MNALPGNIVDAPLSRSGTQVRRGMPVRGERIRSRARASLIAAPRFTTRTRQALFPTECVMIGSIRPFGAYAVFPLRGDIVDAPPSWSDTRVGRGWPVRREVICSRASGCSIASPMFAARTPDACNLTWCVTIRSVRLFTAYAPVALGGEIMDTRPS